MSDHAGQGKIQRCPLAIREELNQRLINGQLGPEVLPWLNSLPEVRAICAAHFAGEEVSAKNLSDYRTGAYAKWLRRREQLARQQELNAYALQAVQSSGLHLSEAAASLAAGKLLAAIEAIGDDETPPKDMLDAINDLRFGDQKSRELKMKEESLRQKEAELSLREQTTAWAVAAKIKKALESRELQAVADSDASDESKMRDFVRIAFGDDLLSRMQLNTAANAS